MRRASAVGVRGVLVPGVEFGGWTRLRRLAQTHGWRFALGTHPHALARSQAVPDQLHGASAIGECGLDGAVGVPWEVQERVLIAHLAVAHEAGLPVILHCWRAHDRLLPLLRRFGPVRGVMHSYSGGADLVDAYVAAGLHLSFAGATTRPGARRPLAAVRRVPRERLLVETDAPDQRPHPLEGRCEPADLVVIVRAVEAARGEALEAVLTANAEALFGAWPGEPPPPG